MTVDDVVNRLKELGSKASLSSSDKEEVEDLYLEVLDKKFTRTSCSDCYRDAIIECSIYLKKYGKMKEKCEYKLRNGILLQLEFGSSEFYTNDNLTDDVSEKYLAKYPENINYFSKYPENWEKRTKSKKEVVINEELLEYMEESLKDGVTAQSVVETFADYTIDGKKISKKVLTAHVNKALEVLADIDSDKEPSQEEETADQEENGQQEEDK